MTLEQHVEARIKRLEPDAQTLLVAVSGGSDSVALLRLLENLDYRLEIAHFDHALRPDSGEDAEFVRSLCADLSLPLHTERAEVARIARAKGWNLEDAARRLRYAFLTRTAKRLGADAVVTGHTRDDQAETVLMQFLRGAAYLRGMPPKQRRVARPLLERSREDLEHYLITIGQTYRTDASNADLSKTRAWLRHEVLPLLKARYPNLAGQLAQLAVLQRDQAAHFERLAARLFEEGLPVSALQKEDAAVQREAIAELSRRAEVSPDAFHIETLREHLMTASPFRLSLPKGRTARLAYGRLEVVPDAPNADLVQPPATLPNELDPAKLAAFPNATYRTRRPGDRIRLAGGSKKLSDLLIERKVPREARDTLRLLASEEEVLWVEGVAADMRVARTREDSDVRWMRLALERARAAATRGELPIGAVVVHEGRVIGSGTNATEAERDPTAHAEVRALRNAAHQLGDWRLTGCTLFVTLEPCPMCFGAALQAHLPRLVYGAPNLREGALGGVSDMRQSPWKREIEVRSGVLAREAGELLSDFFKSRR